MLIVLPSEGVLQRQRRFRHLRSFDEPMDERRLADGLAADDQQVSLGSQRRLRHGSDLRLLLLLQDRKLPDVVGSGCCAHPFNDSSIHLFDST